MKLSARGQQLSINFLVKFILAIVMFALGIVFMWSIYSHATETQSIIDQDFKNRVVDLNCKSSLIVCTSTQRITLGKGDTEIVDVEVHNLHSISLQYDVTVIVEDEAGGQILDSSAFVESGTYGGITLFVPTTQLVLDSRGEGSFPVGIQVDKTAQKGFYSMIIAVDPAGGPSGDLPAIFRTVNLEIR